MLARAEIDYNRKEGYVVVWFDGEEAKPLKNFGDWKSAAIEFRDFLNHHTTDRTSKQIAEWIRKYDPQKLYSYPHMTSLGMIVTPLQRGE